MHRTTVHPWVYSDAQAEIGPPPPRGPKQWPILPPATSVSKPNHCNQRSLRTYCNLSYSIYTVLTVHSNSKLSPLYHSRVNVVNDYADNVSA